MPSLQILLMQTTDTLNVKTNSEELRRLFTELWHWILQTVGHTRASDWCIYKAHLKGNKAGEREQNALRYTEAQP